MKKIFYFTSIFLSLIFSYTYEAESKSLKIVTTTTTYADLVTEIGKEHVDVQAVASPKFNLHFIQPRPSDVRKVSKADLFVFTGLDIETWVDPLLEAAGRPELFRGQDDCLDLSQGITLLDVPKGPLDRSLGDLHVFGNPHCWMSPKNIRIMAGTIRDKLCEIDPQNETEFRKNADVFLIRLDKKISEWKQSFALCSGKEIISYHKDIEYLTEFLGISVREYVEPKPGFPLTPKHLVHLEQYIQAHHIRVIAKPTFYPQGNAEKMAKKLGIQMVTVCQQVGELPELKTVFDLLDYNIKTLTDSLM